MTLRMNVLIALNALLANKLRSLLTMLGIIIGVGSVVALLAVGSGAQESILSEISGIGSNLIIVSPGRAKISPGASLLRGGASAGRLTEADGETIRAEVPDARSVAPIYSAQAKLTAQGISLLLGVTGATPDFASVRAVEMKEGRWLTADDESTGARVAVLGARTAEDLFGGLSPVGQRIRLNNTAFEVIGVTAPVGTTLGGDGDRVIYIPLSTGYRSLFGEQSATGGSNDVSGILVEARTGDVIDQVKTDIEASLRTAHRLDTDEDADFTVTTQTQFLDIANNVTSILTILLAAIAAISLVVGGIGIMNIMLVSVTERTKEIGLRKAVGAKRRTILMQFLVETVLLSVAGGLIGILAGVAVALLVSASGVIAASVSVTSIFLALGFSVAVGLFFGIYPAGRAASLQPIEALRYE